MWLDWVEGIIIGGAISLFVLTILLLLCSIIIILTYPINIASIFLLMVFFFALLGLTIR